MRTRVYLDVGEPCVRKPAMASSDRYKLGRPSNGGREGHEGDDILRL